MSATQTVSESIDAKSGQSNTVVHQVTQVKTWPEIVIQEYGPLAFGLVALFLIWQFIVQPQLASARVDFKANQALVEQMMAVSESMHDTAETQEKTALALSVTATTIERVLDRVDRMESRRIDDAP